MNGPYKSLAVVNFPNSFVYDTSNDQGSSLHQIIAFQWCQNCGSIREEFRVKTGLFTQEKGPSAFEPMNQ